MIQIYENWYMDADDRNYILCELTNSVDKLGNPIYKNHKYYSSVGRVLDGCLKSMERRAVGESKSLDDALNKLDTLVALTADLRRKIVE